MKRLTNRRRKSTVLSPATKRKKLRYRRSFLRLVLPALIGGQEQRGRIQRPAALREQRTIIRSKVGEGLRV